MSFLVTRRAPLRLPRLGRHPKNAGELSVDLLALRDEICLLEAHDRWTAVAPVQRHDAAADSIVSRMNSHTFIPRSLHSFRHRLAPFRQQNVKSGHTPSVVDIAALSFTSRPFTAPTTYAYRCVAVRSCFGRWYDGCNVCL